MLYGARWLSLDARWFDDARRAALGTCGTLCRIVSDGPDRVIVEVAGAQPGGPATPAGRVQAIKHGDHTDYVHDGHLHRAHDATHAHGPGCAHEAVPHAGHVDYVVEGHLHHPHDGHCDDHGVVSKG